MIFPDNPWKRVLAYSLTESLGEQAERLDVEGFIDEYVETFGFVDSATVDPDALKVMVDKHTKSPQADEDPPV